MFPLPVQVNLASLALLFSICILLSATLALPSSPSFVPLTVGTYWIYKTVAQDCDDQTLTVQKQTVLDSFTRGPIIYALIENRNIFEHHKTTDRENTAKTIEPQKEANSRSRTPAAYSIAMLVNNTHYYELSSNMGCDEKKTSVNDAWIALKTGSIRSVEPAEYDLVMKEPAVVGTRWASDPERTDGWYGWRVESAKRQVAQFSPYPESTEYTVAFRTCPDHQIHTFVPGIGVTKSEYHHHGTVMEHDSRLIDFHIADPAW